MAMNENSTTQIDNDNSSLSNNQNHSMIDIPLYAEAKITRKQAIRDIADVILSSNMKPRTVKYALQLLQKVLPIDNTLPTTIDELFGAMMSSENDWRLAQYLIKHKQCPSFLPSSSPFVTFDSNDSSSNSDEENDDEDKLTPYERLEQCLRPIIDVTRDFNLNDVTSLRNNNISSFDQRSQLISSSINPPTFLESFKRIIGETSSIASTNEEDLFYTRLFYDDDTENETSVSPISNVNNKLCCFEINGYDLLNGGKQR